MAQGPTLLSPIWLLGSVDAIPTGSTLWRRWGAKMAQKRPRARNRAGGPENKRFPGPPITARTPAGRKVRLRSLTVVYRGGPDPPKRRTRCASGIKPQNYPFIGGNLPRVSPFVSLVFPVSCPPQFVAAADMTVARSCGFHGATLESKAGVLEASWDRKPKTAP